jgi:hypothetical protein
MPLDPKSETIIDAYLINGGNQSDAWKAGHPNSKAKPSTIAVEASKFFAQPNVRLRIVERQSEVASQSAALTALTLDAHVKELIALRNMAKDRGMIGPAVKAEELLGQLGQHYVKRVHATGTVDHQHTHEAKPISETISWLEGVLGERPARKPAKPLPN